ADLLEEERAALEVLRANQPGPRTVAAAERLADLYPEMAGFDPQYVALRRGDTMTVEEARSLLDP
ncbi:hypothetical protein, partial [Actinoplanes siamensis]